jgi:hypothetical protein
LIAGNLGQERGMAPPISDAVVVDVLRRVDRLLTPAVGRLTRPPVLPQADRDQWWADSVPRVAAALAAAPRFLGKLADLLPLQNTVGTAVQSVVVLGVAGEHGVHAPAERVSLLSRVLLDRSLPTARVEQLRVRSKGMYREEAFGPADARRGFGGNLRTLWRVARLLSRIDDALDARPKGKLRHRALSNLPVVGVLGGYSAEREGLRRAAALAAAVLDEPVSA